MLSVIDPLTATRVVVATAATEPPPGRDATACNNRNGTDGERS